MKNPMENLFSDYENSLRLNAKLVSSILGMSKALLETNEIRNVIVADLMITDLHKYFTESPLIQQNVDLFQSLINFVDDVDADCKVKKLMLNL